MSKRVAIKNTFKQTTLYQLESNQSHKTESFKYYVEFQGQDTKMKIKIKYLVTPRLKFKFMATKLISNLAF